jgi:hypothetical protein
MIYEANNRTATVAEQPSWSHHRFEIVRFKGGKKQVSAWAKTENGAHAIAKEWVA